MAFLLITYTTYDEIRSLLGVTSKELSDVTLALPHWALATEQDMRDIDAGTGRVITEYDTVAAIVEGSRTAAQAQYYKVVRLFALYSVGVQLVRSADSFSPLKITDGRAAVERIEDRFEKLKSPLAGGWQALKTRVEAALLVLVPAATIPAAVARTYTVGVGLGTDPVTGT